MSNERKRPGLGFFAAILATLAVLYVLSSGPTRMGAVLRSSTWRTVYRPLQWATRHWWGRPLLDYWTLFPRREIQLDGDNGLKFSGEFKIYRSVPQNVIDSGPVQIDGGGDIDD